jgi:hypothetical protein
MFIVRGVAPILNTSARGNRDETTLPPWEQLSRERGQSFDELAMETILHLPQNRPKEETRQDSV